MRTRVSIILVVLIWSFLPAEAQTTKDAPDENIINQGPKFMPGYFGCDVINSTNRTLSITVFIAQDESGATGYNENNLVAPIDYLIELLAPIGISFEICEIREMENFQFNALTAADELDDMTAMYYQPNTINLYLLQSINFPGEGNINGFAFPPDGNLGVAGIENDDLDVIGITKASMNGESKILAHELGHYFGLYNTFEDQFGEEFVDGSNCETTGDLVCDTEADPSANGTQAADCNYLGPINQDTNGDFYVPPTNNLMSNYSLNCRCRFTPQQYNRMLEQYQFFRSNLW
ncbi:MAG: M43 family zinc metalloprotease [Bacteroidota bacterium]